MLLVFTLLYKSLGWQILKTANFLNIQINNMISILEFLIISIATIAVYCIGFAIRKTFFTND